MPVYSGGRQIDQLMFSSPNGSSLCNNQIAYVINGYDADGRLIHRQDTYGWWQQNFGYAEDGGWYGQGGTDSVYRSMATRTGGSVGGSWSSVDSYFDARNRLWQRILPAGHEELRFYDSNDNLLVMATPLASDATQLVHDDHIWLDGKLVAVVRGRNAANGNHYPEDLSDDCSRVGSTGACGIVHIVNDILPKPILAIHAVTGKITGYAMYDEFGAVNLVPTVAGTAHSYSTFPDGGVVSVTTVPSMGEVDVRALYSYIDLPKTTGVAVNSGTPIKKPMMGRVWSGWTPHSHSRAVVKTSGPTSASYYGVTTQAIEFRGYATGAIPYFPQLRFPGHYVDQESGLHFNWSRIYDTESGRYFSTEPLLKSSRYSVDLARQGHSAPVYSYANNNPVRNTDRDGRKVYFHDEGVHWSVSFDLSCQPETLTCEPGTNDPKVLKVDYWCGDKDSDPMSCFNGASAYSAKVMNLSVAEAGNEFNWTCDVGCHETAAALDRVLAECGQSYKVIGHNCRNVVMEALAAAGCGFPHGPPGYF